MSIQHLDDLSSRKMIDVVNRIDQFTTSIKLDGANLWFGIDNLGVFVSREGKNKSAARMYSGGDFEDVAPNDQFKATLSALQAVKTKLSEVMTPTDLVEIEVIFGSQPNVVKYHDDDSKASIVFLRGVEGTKNEVVVKLGQVLENIPVTVDCEVKQSADGQNLQTETISVEFNFFTNKKYNTSAILKISDLSSELSELETIMNSDSEIVGKTNADLEDTKSTEENKRAKVNSVLKIAEAKKKLKNKIYSILSEKIDAKEDKEGFVISNNEEIYKIVDRNNFGIINDFYQSVRKTAVSSILTTDPNADPTKRGGIVGHTKIEMAKYLGFPDFARAQAAKQSLKELGEQEFLKQFKIQNLEVTKNKLIAIANNGLKLLNIQFLRFDKSKGGELKRDNGSVSFTEPVIKRSKVAFAEATSELTKIRDGIINSKSVQDVITAVFGRFIDLNKNIAEQLKGQNMISYMLLEDEAGDTTASQNSGAVDLGTKASDIAPKETVIGTGRYKFVMRKRNDSVLQAMKQKKLKIDKGA